jgi:hypothetical protein
LDGEPFFLAGLLIACGWFGRRDSTYSDDAPRGVRGDPGAHRKGRLTCGFVDAHDVRCDRYGRNVDAEMTLI